MRILIIGGTGTVGQAVVNALSPRHEMIIAAHEHGDLRVDIADVNSMENMYKKIGNIDAVSPTVLTESMNKYADFFRGFLPVHAAKVALGYVKSVEGAQTGKIYCIG